MGLYEQYELLEALPGAGIKSFKSREKASGREVLVHLLVGADERVLRQVESLVPEKRKHVIAQGDHLGTRYVVTDTQIGSGTFESWLAAAGGGSGEAPLSQTGKWDITQMNSGSAASPEPGEFTRMFQAPAAGSAPEPPKPAAPADPGEFTRMFQAPASERETEIMPPPQAPPPVPPPGPTPAPKSEQAGEFTRMFQAPGKEPASSAPQAPAGTQFTRVFGPPAAEKPAAPKAPAPAGPGDFTRFFQGDPGTSGKPPAPGPRSSAPPPGGQFTRMFERNPMGESPSAGQGSAGEFTRIFGKAQAPPPEPVAQPVPPAPPRPSETPGEFTRMFESPGAPPVPPPAPAPPAPQYPPPQFQAPQFQPPQAQMPQYQPPQFQAPQLQTPQYQAPAPQAAPLAAGKPTNYLPLVLILAALLVVAVAMAVYFAVR